MITHLPDQLFQPFYNIALQMTKLDEQIDRFINFHIADFCFIFTMKECEALCTSKLSKYQLKPIVYLTYLEIGIMKTGQFMYLGNLQHLRNHFGNDYAIQVKIARDDIEKVKQDLITNLSGIEI
ncbi:unnamed protein product [Rotaria sp. Silwood2]|nr:unnamed protein product [Rotaria sp. Silwood2]CAF2594968.1 unnamed protein product [Rotaria sp. Silwood2]CAF2857577.1 unnamed protein product [Rotaria sp. Silwood2]CAF3299045.1 unnamed protein product [Rotaria sp. Silwood2]CAF3907660.1 unnamed protein product [Rotaria sp. Silwood2]